MIDLLYYKSGIALPQYEECHLLQDIGVFYYGLTGADDVTVLTEHMHIVSSDLKRPIWYSN